jgi:hypothetical protein
LYNSAGLTDLLKLNFHFSIFDMSKEEKRNDRFESYPRPTETDKQLQNQPEYIDQQPNDFEDKSVSDIPNTNAERISNDPKKETGE